MFCRGVVLDDVEDVFIIFSSGCSDDLMEEPAQTTTYRTDEINSFTTLKPQVIVEFTGPVVSGIVNGWIRIILQGVHNPTHICPGFFLHKLLAVPDELFAAQSR